MSGNSGFAKNIELIGYHDLNGKPGFQMAMQEVGGKYYLYVAHFKSSGWSILEVTDPQVHGLLNSFPGRIWQARAAGQDTGCRWADDYFPGRAPAMLQGNSWEIPTRKACLFGTSKILKTPSGFRTGRPVYQEEWACTAFTTRVGDTFTYPHRVRGFLP